MRKTSVYLTDEHAERLAELSRVERRPQAEVIRDAITQYRTPGSGDRAFAVTRSGRGRDGASIAETPEEELLSGFGE